MTWLSASAHLRGVLHTRHNSCICFARLRWFIRLRSFNRQPRQTAFYPAKAISLEISEPVRQRLPNQRTGNGGPWTLNSSATNAERRCGESTLFVRLPVTEAPCLRLAEEFVQTPETMRRSRRLTVLQDQLQLANRRAAGPFSHPFASRGSLSGLREQIRDVSRVADAVMLNAESASDYRINELCADVRSLLQTQQRWTDRLENQIWRLESQASLMQRLQRLLLDGSPGNDCLWELCDVIARETQALPSGLLLLPEPGHRILLANNHISSRASWSLEQARLAVFSGVTLLPDVRGADIVAQTLQALSSDLLEFARRDHDASVFAEPSWMKRIAIAGPVEEVSRLINLAGTVLTAIDTLSQTAKISFCHRRSRNFTEAFPLRLKQTPSVLKTLLWLVPSARRWVCHLRILRRAVLIGRQPTMPQLCSLTNFAGTMEQRTRRSNDRNSRVRA